MEVTLKAPSWVVEASTKGSVLLTTSQGAVLTEKWRKTMSSVWLSAAHLHLISSWLLRRDVWLKDESFKQLEQFHIQLGQI